MKYKNLFRLTGMAFAVAMTFAACSQDDAIAEAPQPAADEQPSGNQFVYTLHLDCDAPAADGTQTRATTSWANGSKIYLKFGSTYGTATYSTTSQDWTIVTNGSLAATSSATSCSAYYFVNPYSESSTEVTLTPKSAIYQGQGTYTHPSGGDVYVKATLSPKTWRMRFNGASVRLLGSKSDLKYNSSFNLSSGSFSMSTMTDIDLTSTEYVYGQWNNTSGNNTLVVQNGNDTYKKTVKGSNIQAPASVYFTAPNSSNYSTYGWEKSGGSTADPNLYLKPDMFVLLTTGFATAWTVGSNTSYCYDITMKKSEADSKNEDQLLEELMKYSSSAASDISETVSWNDKLSANTDYYLLTVAFNSSGSHSEIYKYAFHTPADNQPLAEISNLRSGTQDGTAKWQLSITLKNGASNYYLIDDNRDVFFTNDDFYYAWCCYRWINTGQVTDTYNFTGGVNWNRNNETQTTVLTWALTSSNQLAGKVCVARAQASSSARSTTPASSTVKERADGTKSVHQYPMVIEAPAVHLYNAR